MSQSVSLQGKPMPSGATHDRLILWNLPWVGGVTWLLTSDLGLVLAGSGAYLFSGLLFGPDLDTRSRHYFRWGLFRWLWLPYQRLLSHRSVFSHGPLLGTCGRLLYLGGWLVLLGLLSSGLWTLWRDPQRWGDLPQYWQAQGRQLWRTSQTQVHLLVTILVGLEVGAMNHSLSDWLGSRIKRWRRGLPQGHRQSIALTRAPRHAKKKRT
jgi:uncharacterized metal-binding protein